MIIGSNLLRLIPTTAPVAHRAILDLRGSQASQFLNGILATVVHATPKGPFFSAFLHAQAGLFFFKVYFVIKSSMLHQGRVLYDVFIYPYEPVSGQNGYLIEYDSRPSEAPPLLSMLKRYVLRS